MALTPALSSLLRGIPALPRMGPGAEGAPSPAASAPGPGGAPGGPGGLPGGPGTTPDDIFSQIANRRFADSQGADPQMIVSQLKQIKSVAAAMFPKVAFRIPNVEKHLTAMYRSLDMALKEAETFQNQQQSQQGINFTAANIQPGGPAAAANVA